MERPETTRNIRSIGFPRINDLPLRADTLSLLALTRLDDVRCDAKVGLEQEMQAEVSVHEGERRAMRVNVTTGLRPSLNAGFEERGEGTHFDPDALEKPLVDSADTRNFANGEVVHERFDGSGSELESELSVWFVLVGLTVRNEGFSKA